MKEAAILDISIAIYIDTETLYGFIIIFLPCIPIGVTGSGDGR
jgi:hypothetical protein